MRWRRALIPLALTGLTAGLVTPAVAHEARAATTSTTPSLAMSTVQETDLGNAMTLNLPGGGYAVVHAFGSVSVVGAAGQTQWQVTSSQLYRDWDVTWQDPPPVTEDPQLNWGTVPSDPLATEADANGLINDVHPAATGTLNGRPVVAVADTVGINGSPESFVAQCFGCKWPFTVPGSSLTMGTFVSVLDARTGQMLYHELDPGLVTQLAIADSRLIIGDETGDPASPGSIGQWGSVSTVRALAISAAGAATQAWRYSTSAPWARILEVAVTNPGQRPGVAISWSDTPPGLGTPRPPDGHVLLLDAATGTIRWQVRTPGYPVLAAPDDQRAELAVVQQTDPDQSIGYTLTGLSYASGATVLSQADPGAVPLSLAVGHGHQDGWAVGATDATLSSDGQNYTPTQGQVTLTDPATGRALWLRKFPSSQDNAPVPDGLVIAGNTVFAGAFIDAPTQTATDPAAVDDTVTALDYQTGHTDWQQAGDIGDPLSLTAVNGRGGLVRAVTTHQDIETYDASGARAESTAGGPGDYLSGTTASISAPGRTDLVVGNEDGDVSALDGRSLAGGTEQVLWRTHLPGPVLDIARATVDGRPVLVVAATSAIAVLDTSTGRLLRLIATPGTYAYTDTVISAAGTPAVVVPGTSLTAYSLTTGARLWSQAAPSGASFSGGAYADGVVAAEYSSSSASSGRFGSTPATEMGAVGVSAATGTPIWTQLADPSAVTRGQLWNGAFASPDIPGASGRGVAFAWADDNATAVDVRDITTGALLYQDSAPDLSGFSQFLASPSLGLIAITQTGSALITPSGAEESQAPSGLSAALATTASGQQGLLTAPGTVDAFSTDVFTASSPSWQDSVGIDQSGTLISGDFAGNGTQQVVALPANWQAYMIVGQETGYNLPGFVYTVQRGLAFVTLRDGGATSATAHGPAAPAPGPAGSVAYPGPADRQQGPSQPAGTGPAGQAGSVAPVNEPARTGDASPGTSPSTVRHTITAQGADAAAEPPGYSPAQMKALLGLSGDGQGQTIAIVDAYDDPDITADAETFSQQYGLPGVCGAGGTAGQCFTLDVSQQSASAPDPTGGQWDLETSLDVEWAHAIAPDATIRLVEADSQDFASLFSAVATASATHPAAVSMSWGLDEEFSDETWYDHFCAVAATVCVVSAGDRGHPGGYPAYNPSALAIGGTTLNLTGSGAVTSEQDWSGSGGGQSWVEPEPAYQDKVQSSGQRQMPDVAFDADLNTGVAIYDSVPLEGQTGWFEVGGTSVGAPSWSGILADADQLRAARRLAPLTAAGDAVQRAVYSLPASVIAPVPTGPANGFCPVGCTPTAGYDQITGLGSPRAGIDGALAAAAG
ncbi:MAG TPA: PQQ-binding-like beta-propeller repeat protein [Trebonia sp.]|nr:PQQ-binding-like beta-propeller repeat protein [Trebonia sp.]